MSTNHFISMTKCSPNNPSPLYKFTHYTTTIHLTTCTSSLHDTTLYTTTAKNKIIIIFSKQHQLKKKKKKIILSTQTQYTIHIFIEESTWYGITGPVCDTLFKIHIKYLNVALNIANPFEIAVSVVILFATAVVDVFFWQGAAHGQDKNENRLEEVNCYSFRANVVLNCVWIWWSQYIINCECFMIHDNKSTKRFRFLPY